MSLKLIQNAYGFAARKREKLGNNSAISVAEIFREKTRRNISATSRNYSRVFLSAGYKNNYKNDVIKILNACT